MHSQLSQPDDAAGSLQVDLSQEEMNHLTLDYVPHEIVGYE